MLVICKLNHNLGILTTCRMIVSIIVSLGVYWGQIKHGTQPGIFHYTCTTFRSTVVTKKPLFHLNSIAYPLHFFQSNQTTVRYKIPYKTEKAVLIPWIIYFQTSPFMHVYLNSADGCHRWHLENPNVIIDFQLNSTVKRHHFRAIYLLYCPKCRDWSNPYKKALCKRLRIRFKHMQLER